MVQTKLHLQQKARAMRARGSSINEIYRSIGAAKSSVSVWVRNVPLSPEARQKIESRWTKGQDIAHAKRRAQTAERLEQAAQYGKNVMEGVRESKEIIQLNCALLYWCEGEKSLGDRMFTFTNSDPRLISAFLGLLRRGFDIDEAKLRACVHLHDYHDERKQLQFWSKVTNMPLSQFMKPYQKPHTGKQKRDGYAGCIAIRYYDVKIARAVQGIARAFLKKYGPIS